MKKRYFLIGVFLIVNLCLTGMSATNADMRSEKELINALNSPKVFTRVDAMETIIKALRNGEMKLSGDLKKVCYNLIEEKIQNRIAIDTREDEEGQYSSAVIELAAEINDKKWISYFSACLPDPVVVKALVKQNDEGINAIISLLDKPELKLEQQNTIIHSFNTIIKLQQEGYSVSGSARAKIIEAAKRILDGIQYIVPKDRDNITIQERGRLGTQVALKINILKLFAVLGDKELIPIVERLAREDENTKMVPKSILPRLRMSDEARSNESREKKRDIYNAYKAGKLRSDERVIYYPVREEALKTLRKLEQ